MNRSRSTRTTRSARGSTKSRRAGSRGGFADRIRRAAESGPTRKWVKVMRPPAPKIRFLVSKWVAFNELTDEERLEYGKQQAAIQEEKQKQEMLLQQQAQQDDQKDHEAKIESIPSDSKSTESTSDNASAPGPTHADNNTIIAPVTEELVPPTQKRELAQETKEPVDEPPPKRLKADEQVPAPANQML